jgi:hypothetical protein
VDSVDAAVSSELEALGGAGLEVSADRCAVFVDGAIVGGVWHAEVDACAILADGEGHFAEVAFRELVGEVVLAGATPVGDVLGGDEDGTGALVAAGAATEAGLVGHRDGKWHGGGGRAMGLAQSAALLTIVRNQFAPWPNRGV